MLVISLDAAKEQVGVLDNLENSFIESLVIAAQSIVEDALERPLVGEGGWETIEAIPAAIIHAIKLIVAELYAKREASEADLGLAMFLIGPHARVSVGG